MRDIDKFFFDPPVEPADNIDRHYYACGYMAALRCWAWWKDGQQYVGHGSVTLKEVVEHVEKRIADLKEKP